MDIEKIKKQCLAYSPQYEERRENIGTAGGEPIYITKNILIREYCSLRDAYKFDCSKCEFRPQISIDSK